MWLLSSAGRKLLAREWTARTRLDARSGSDCDVTVGKLRRNPSYGGDRVELNRKYNPHSAMAAFQLTKKALSLPPTVRTLASGVPSASLINLNARAPAHGDHHAHGEVGPRSDVPAAWASKLSTTPVGLVSKNYASGEWFSMSQYQAQPAA